MKTVTLADGLVVTLAREVDQFGGGSWGPDDRITFARGGTLWQVRASGGSPQPLTTLDGGRHELLQAWPTAVAEGRVILFTSITGTGRNAGHIEALSVATGQRRVVVDSGVFPQYLPSGHLIFFRDGALLAAPFNVERLAVSPPVRVVEDLAVDVTGALTAAVSLSGALVYSANSTGAARLVWATRQGVEQPIGEATRPYETPRVAPDGHRVAVLVAGDLWIQDATRATFTRLTSDETVGNSYPVWTPDGQHVVFRTRTGLYSIDTEGSGRLQAIAGTSVADVPSSISPDGDTLAFNRQTADTSSDVDVLSLRGEPHPHAVVKTHAFEGGADFAPDGRWLVYASDESGQMQVYVRPFPGPDRKWPVSTEGGTSPRWNKNGRELFYRNGNKLMAVDVAPGPELALSAPRLLFEQRDAYGRTTTTANYDVSPDGQRFLMVKDEPGFRRLNVVLNWVEELKRLVPTK